MARPGVGAVLFLVLGAFGCHDPAPAPAPPRPAPPVQVQVLAADAGSGEEPAQVVHETLPGFLMNLSSGTAEVRRAGTNQWIVLKIGDPIRQGDAVRSAADNQLELTLGQGHIRVNPGGQLSLEALDASMIRAHITGQVEAQSAQGEQSIELQGEEGVYGRVSAGRFLMNASSSGRTQLAVLSGSASLQSGDKSVELGEGESTSIERGKLGARSKVPKNVALHVGWPPNDATNQALLSLNGHVGAWTHVVVQNKEVTPGADGTFLAKVALKPGKQRVAVVATDVFGRHVAQTHVITMDPTAPAIKARVEYR